MNYLSIPIEQCPYCNSTEGYYTKGQVRGSIITRYNYDGSDADNGDIYEHLTHTGGKLAYCLSCNGELMSWNSEDFDKVFTIDELREIFKTMDLPEGRINNLSNENLRWLQRNIAIRNKDNDKLNRAIELIKMLLK